MDFNTIKGGGVRYNPLVPLIDALIQIFLIMLKLSLNFSKIFGQLVADKSQEFAPPYRQLTKSLYLTTKYLIGNFLDHI